MTITANDVSELSTRYKELSERLRSRAMRHPYRSLDRNLMVEAAEILGDTGMAYATDEAELNTDILSNMLDATMVNGWLDGLVPSLFL